MGEGSRSLQWQVFSLVAPATLAYTVEGITHLLPIWAAGRHIADASSASPDYLADASALQISAVGLGGTALTFVARMLGSGWTSGEDALVSQAFGRGDFQQARKHLHQCQVWMVLFACTCTALLIHIEAVLQCLDLANAEVVALASEYVLACIPGVWFQFQFDALRKFLMNQQLPTPGMVVVLVNVPVQAAVCYVLLYIIRMRTMTALGLAYSLHASLCFLLLAAYSSFWCQLPSCRGWWKPWTSEGLFSEGLRSFAKVGLPSTAMVAVEWTSFEVLTILAGWLADEHELAAQVAAGAASGYLYMVVYGVAKAACALVGAAHGQGDPAAAWRAFQTCGMCGCMLCTGLIVFLAIHREGVVAFLLQDSGAAADRLNALMPLIVVQLLLDASNSLLQGAHSGLGNHAQVTLGFVVTCWIIQLPLAYTLAFNLSWGVYGLRVASAVGVGLDLAFNVALLLSCLKPYQRGKKDRWVTDFPAHEYCAMRPYRPFEELSEVQQTTA